MGEREEYPMTILFKKLQAIRTQVARIPGLSSDTDFDIAVEVGYRQREGHPLTLKQLLLLNISSAATVRRHLSRLIREGIIIKLVVPNDHRTVQLLLSDGTIADLERCLQKIHRTICDTPTNCGHDG